MRALVKLKIEFLFIFSAHFLFLLTHYSYLTNSRSTVIPNYRGYKKEAMNSSDEFNNVNDYDDDDDGDDDDNECAICQDVRTY